MSHRGFIKVDRGIDESDVWTNDWLFRLWIGCIMKANFKALEYKNLLIERGSFAFTERKLCSWFDVGRTKLRSGLTQLRKLGMIEIPEPPPNQLFSVATVINYETYQGMLDDTRTSDRTTDRTSNETSDRTSDCIANQPQEEEFNKVKKDKKVKKLPPTPKELLDSSEELPDSFLAPALRNAVENWLAHKQERGESYKPTGLKGLIAKVAQRCREHGVPAVVEAFEVAIAAGTWAGWDFKETWAKSGGNRQNDPHGNLGARERYLLQLGGDNVDQG